MSSRKIQQDKQTDRQRAERKSERERERERENEKARQKAKIGGNKQAYWIQCSERSLAWNAGRSLLFGSIAQQNTTVDRTPAVTGVRRNSCYAGGTDLET